MSAERISGFTLDHVELFVPDRDAAAAWYATVLGCERVRGAEQWAADPTGPLMVSPDGGRTKLALFAGEPQGGRATAGFHRVAFRLPAAAWSRFAAGLLEQGIVGLAELPARPRHLVLEGLELRLQLRVPCVPAMRRGSRVRAQQPAHPGCPGPCVGGRGRSQKCFNQRR